MSEESLIREAHQKFKQALAEPAEPATTTLHRPNCTRPGWLLAKCHRPSGVQLARCTDCGSVELRTTDKENKE
jgi:hypothetical protein